MNDHPSLEEVGSYLEETLGSKENRRLEEHLGSCPQCYARYAELSRSLMDWGRDPRAGTPPLDLLNRVKKLSRSEPSTATRGRRGVWYWAAAGVAAALGVVLWLVFIPAGSKLDDSLIASIDRAMNDASANGLFFSEEGSPAGDPVVYRGRQVQESVDELHEIYESGMRTEEVTYWLVSGYLANGNLRSARSYLREGRAAYPKSSRLALLSAILHYKQNDLEESEAALRIILSDDTKHALALANLVVVLQEQGRGDEAEGLLGQLDQTAEGSFLERVRRRLNVR